MVEKKVGHYSFLAGVLLALVLALFSGAMSAYTISIIVLVLVILGLIVGFLNVTAKETTEFLVAAITLMIVSTANLSIVNGFIPGLGTLLQSIVTYIAVFVAPAALIVALKAIKQLAEK